MRACRWTYLTNVLPTDECFVHLFSAFFIFFIIPCNNINTTLPVCNMLCIIMQMVMLLNLLCVFNYIFLFQLLPSAMHYRLSVSLWQVITEVRYLDRTGWLATRHRFTSFRGTRMGNKRTALILEQADWKWITQQNTTSVRLSEWASMGDFSILNASSKCTVYSHRITPQNKNFVRGFLTCRLPFCPHSHTVDNRDTHSGLQQV